MLESKGLVRFHSEQFKLSLQMRYLYREMSFPSLSANAAVSIRGKNILEQLNIRNKSICFVKDREIFLEKITYQTRQ